MLTKLPFYTLHAKKCASENATSLQLISFRSQQHAGAVSAHAVVIPETPGLDALTMSIKAEPQVSYNESICKHNKDKTKIKT